MPSSRAALTFVLLSVFIDSLGFGIIIPSLPSVIMDLTGEPVSTAADWGGYLMAVYALLQFFMAPIFGNLSDRFGRRPLLLFSLLAFGVDFLLTGLAKSMTWLFVGRAFAGVFGASYSTAGAYIGDISNDDNRAKNFGFIGAAWGSGFTLGPVIGGFVAESIDPRAPFLRRRCAGTRQRGLRVLRAARITAGRAAPQVRVGARQSVRCVEESRPSTHGGRVVVRRVSLPDRARLVARGVDVLHAAQVRLGSGGDRLVAHLRRHHDGHRHGGFDRLCRAAAW
jgi:multidrug resistance protein